MLMLKTRAWLEKPNDAWLDRVTIQPLYTPDHFLLQDRPFHLLFEYSDLKEGFPKHTSLLNLDPLYPGYTAQRFSLWRRNQEKQTNAVALHSTLSDKSIPRTKVKGQVFRVPWEKFLILDNYRANGLQFVRKKVNILLPFHDKSKAKEEIIPKKGNGWMVSTQPFRPISHSMWMYVGLGDYWRHVIDWDYAFYGRTGGRDFTLNKVIEDQTRPWVKRYYEFTREDYDVKANCKSTTVSKVSK